jgi:hypothetical protein
MTALVFASVSPSWLSSLGFYLTLLTVVPTGLLLAPQPIRTDKRVLIGLALLVLVMIGHPTYAAYTRICDWAWFAWECWFV